VLLFGFLAASREARNSDVYFHLAAGRHITEQGLSFSDDPFSFTSAGWVNHAWLHDLLLFRLFTLGGGALLVVIKALAIMILAGVLLGIHRRDSGWLAPAGCTLLALLCMSPRLLLQPICLSYLFLGLTLWLLWRETADQRESAPSWKRLFPLLGVLALWANVDNWFLLGPLLVLIVCVGDRVQGGRGLPLWLPPAALLVCLLNPAGYRVFALPVELSPFLLDNSGIAGDPRFAQQGFASPWNLGLRWASQAAFNLAEYAYFLLVFLGLFSFWLERDGLRWWRVAVWVVFALLGAWQLRTVPFFAVVAGPITALNLQDWASRRASRRQTGVNDSARRAYAAPLALLTSGIALVLLACMGWLQGFPQHGRQAALGLYEDSSLRRVAETVRRWRQKKKLGESDRAFAVHPDVAHYLAWFCPGERSFLDHRLDLSLDDARDFEGVCRQLNPLLPERTGLAGPWQEVFKKHEISLLIVYDPDPRFMLGSLAALVQDHKEWDILAVDGQAVLFGWKNAKRGPDGHAFDELRLDPVRLAFAPRTDDEGPVRAPPEGPGRVPEKRQLWEGMFRPDPPRPWESAAASDYLRWYEAENAADRVQAQRRGWAIYAANLSAVPTRPEAGLGPTLELTMRLRNPAMFADAMTRSPALPLLAIRSARSALAADPDDLNAAMRLGQAYQLLQEVTPEHAVINRSTLIGAVRHMQLVTPLEQALRADPNLTAAHAVLGDLYLNRRYLDAALEHRKAQLRLERRDARDAEARERVELLDVEVQRLEREVQDRQNQFVIRSRTLREDPLAQARLALELGLAQRALDDILLKSVPALFRYAGVRLQFDLMLMLGRADQLGELLAMEEVQQVKSKLDAVVLPLGPPSGEPVFFRLPAYEWFSFCQAAAVGDYRRARETLRELIDFLAGDEERSLPGLRRTVSNLIGTELGLGTRLNSLVSQGVAQKEREDVSVYLRLVEHQRAGRFDLLLLAGLLDLERGEPAQAEENLGEALKLAERDKGLIPLPSRALAATYRRFIQEQR
jgi:tetratricopeptide (TPR) repeat protein